jgi:hypothetical protein
VADDTFALELASASIDLADVAGTLVPVVGKAVAHWANRNTRALIAARDETFRDWVVEEKRATVEHAKRLAEHAEDLEALRLKLEELISDPSFARVRDNYGYEAAREALDERRRMLAFASAGSANLELTVGEIARVERTVRELDPGDVALLRRLAEIVDAPKPALPRELAHAEQQFYAPWEKACGEHAEYRRGLADSHPPSGDVLLSCGCTGIAPLRNTWGQTFPTGIRVTRLGENVLQVLDGYLRARTP